MVVSVTKRESQEIKEGGMSDELSTGRASETADDKVEAKLAGEEENDVEEKDNEGKAAEGERAEEDGSGEMDDANKDEGEGDTERDEDVTAKDCEKVEEKEEPI